MKKIRQLLYLRADDKLLLLVFIVTDDIVCLVAIHLGVLVFRLYRGDTTHNCMDLFITVIRTPTGENFPGNLTYLKVAYVQYHIVWSSH